MKTLYQLLRPRAQGFKNHWVRRRKERRKRPLVMAGLGLGFGAGMFFLSCRILKYFQSIEMIGDLLAKQLLTMILLTFFSMMIFSHIVTALSNLYLSKDLELCHALPVSLEDLFLSRAIFTLLDSSWMLLIFAVPLFGAYAWVYHPGLGYIVTVLHMTLAMAIIAGGVGILVAMLLVYVFPAQRTRDILVLLSIFMIIALYLLFRLLRPERLVNPDAFFTVMQYVGALKAPDSPYLPTTWIRDVLWGSLTRSESSLNLFNALLTWSTAGAMVVMNTGLALRIYVEGFSKSQEARARKAAGKRVLDVLVPGAIRFLNGDLKALLGKDLRVFFRDPTQWSQLLLLGALVVVYVYNFSVLPLDMSPIRLDFLQNEIAFLNMGLAGFVISAISVRFVFSAISAEGEAYWIVRSSPLSLRRYLWGKFLFFLFPMLLLAEILIVATNCLLEVTPLMMVISSVTMALMVFGIVAMGMGFGAVYPNFKHQNIAQVSTGFGGVMYMIVCSIYIALVIVLEAGPVYILFMADARGDPIRASQWTFIISSFLTVLAINVLATLHPLRRGLKALYGHEL